MNNLISVIKNVISAKLMPLVTKVRYWTNATFIQSQIISKIREKLNLLFDIRPRHKDDYYGVGRLLVARKLIQSLTIIIGMLSLVYVFYQYKTYMSADTLVKTYKYNSIPLRFTSGEVEIKAKAGYIAYEGMVDDGYCSGEGKLYDCDRDLVYEGEFAKNQYSGKGKDFYKSGAVRYQGDFLENLYEGMGVFYRENSTMIYNGEFSKGKKEGNGTLFNGSETKIFEGQFHNDSIVYSQLLGKTAQEINEQYTGNESIYVSDSKWVVFMDEINAFYVAGINENSISDEVSTDTIYVYNQPFVYGDVSVSDVKAVTEVLGEPSFEGNSYITMPEAVAAYHIKADNLNSGLSLSRTFDEVATIEEYDSSKIVYLYVYEKDELTYTFVTDGTQGGFYFYSIQK